MVEGGTGLIPSQFLEEKRKAFVPKDLDGAGDTLKHTTVAKTFNKMAEIF